MRDQAFSVSDDLDFWARHVPQMRPIGYAPEPEPEPAPDREPGPGDVGQMDMQAYARYRAEHGIESSDFLGVKPWRRPTANQMNEERQERPR